MKPITIDSQLQSVLEHLNAARKDFSEAYTRITNEGAKNYSTMLRDFKRYTKAELVRAFVAQGGDMDEAFASSFSCYTPEHGKECWSCKPCFRKFIAFALNGYPFTEDIIDRNVSYIRKEILPLIESGTYGRKQEEDEIMQVLSFYK